MNLSALKNLTTAELMALSNEASNIVEGRLTKGIREFLVGIINAAFVKEIRVRKTDFEGPIMVEIGGKMPLMEYVVSNEFVRLKDSGVNPTISLRANDAESEECPFILTAQIELWPDTWAFLQDMDDAYLTAEDALDCYANLHGEKK